MSVPPSEEKKKSEIRNQKLCPSGESSFCSSPEPVNVLMDYLGFCFFVLFFFLGGGSCRFLSIVILRLLNRLLAWR